jgi:hypothetical protein
MGVFLQTEPTTSRAPFTQFVSVEITYRDGSMSEIKGSRR